MNHIPILTVIDIPTAIGRVINISSYPTLQSALSLVQSELETMVNTTKKFYDPTNYPINENISAYRKIDGEDGDILLTSLIKHYMTVYYNNKYMLIETLNTLASEELVKFFKRLANEGAPYNKFFMGLNIEKLSSAAEHINWSIRYKITSNDTPVFTLDSVAGDITQHKDANPLFFKKPDQPGEEFDFSVLHDCKAFGNIPESLRFIARQEEQQGFQELKKNIELRKKRGRDENGTQRKTKSTKSDKKRQRNDEEKNVPNKKLNIGVSLEGNKFVEYAN